MSLQRPKDTGNELDHSSHREEGEMYRLITTLALLVGVHPTSAVSGGLRGKSLIFSQPSSTSYVKLLPRRFPELRSFTLCLLSATELTRNHALFSYATPDNANQLLFWVLELAAQQIPFELPDPGSLLRHLCVSWESETGRITLWADGRRSLVKTARQGQKVTGGGVVILGQEQDQVGGGFDAKQSFVGELSQVNLWDRVLGQREVSEINRGCGCLGGNVIDWSTVAFESRGTVGISDSPECEL
ncbi:mucosal pentraxin-like isoform X3 [Pristis pectinata]|uniref:mucosal pentraxin-like isoform X3 n=1 Tax=Pristis pectinata TaxID=685728 RepID=UPI00223CDBC2|nr:mucosal pentraxin-like isoform X3 [Pristis pectinata]